MKMKITYPSKLPEKKDDAIDALLTSYDAMVYMACKLSENIDYIKEIINYFKKDSISKSMDAQYFEAERNSLMAVVRWITERISFLTEEEIELLHDYYEERMTAEQLEEKYMRSIHSIKAQLKEIRGTMYD